MIKRRSKKKTKNIPLKMFLYAESPEQERNTLSHLTEAFGLVFPNCTATFCSEDLFGVMEKGVGGVGWVTEKVVWASGGAGGLRGRRLVGRWVTLD